MRLVAAVQVRPSPLPRRSDAQICASRWTAKRKIVALSVTIGHQTDNSKICRASGWPAGHAFKDSGDPKRRQSLSRLAV
jgi:hypothetical protein